LMELDGKNKRFKVEDLKIEIYPDRATAGAAAAHAVATAFQAITENTEVLGVIFATGVSQLATLEALTKMPDLPWDRVCGFHLDEYVGMSFDHSASFRHYLRKNLSKCVTLQEFHEIDGSTGDPEEVCREYAAKLRVQAPQLCLLGIGENGHLAFNDPEEANFEDPADVKVVELDALCRQQQTAEGWFESVQDVPERAITLTIPTIFRVPKLVISVPGIRKAAIIRRTLLDAISPECPATILRRHPDATVYLDSESASELDDLLHGNLKQATLIS
jgi:glucosamine-6-phosphate deaminase